MSVQTVSKTSQLRAKISKIIEAWPSTNEKNQTLVKAASYARVKHFSFEQAKMQTYCECKQRKDAFDQQITDCSLGTSHCRSSNKLTWY